MRKEDVETEPAPPYARDVITRSITRGICKPFYRHSRSEPPRIRGHAPHLAHEYAIKSPCNCTGTPPVHMVVHLRSSMGYHGYREWQHEAVHKMQSRVSMTAVYSGVVAVVTSSRGGSVPGSYVCLVLFHPNSHHETDILYSHRYTALQARPSCHTMHERISGQLRTIMSKKDISIPLRVAETDPMPNKGISIPLRVAENIAMPQA